jgi:hypothetical protein
MNDVLLDTIVNKLKIMDDSIKEVKNHMLQVPDYSEQLKTVNTNLDKVMNGVTNLPQQLKFPTIAIHTLSQQLEVNNDLLMRPPQQEIRHHHHINAGVVVSGVLLMLLFVACMWLYNTYSRLQDYEVGDIKYRYLKLNADKPVLSLISATDSLYKADNVVFRESVIKKEAEREQRAELLMEAERKEIKALQLRNKAKQIK